MTNDQNKLVKARKAARLVFAMIIFAGAVITLYGIYTNYFPTILQGLVLFAASTIPFVVAKKTEQKIQDLGV